MSPPFVQKTGCPPSIGPSMFLRRRPPDSAGCQSSSRPPCLSQISRAFGFAGRRSRITQHVRLLGFIAGLPPDFSLSGVCRSWSRLCALCEALSAARGRQARDLGLPVNYDTHRVYSMAKGTANGTVMTPRFIGQTARLRYDQLPNFDDFSELNVCSNWSETPMTTSAAQHSCCSMCFLSKKFVAALRAPTSWP